MPNSANSLVAFTLQTFPSSPWPSPGAAWLLSRRLRHRPLFHTIMQWRRRRSWRCDTSNRRRSLSAAMTKPMPLPPTSFDEICMSMQSLIDDGKIRGWGLCNDNAYGLIGCTQSAKFLGVSHHHVQYTYRVIKNPRGRMDDFGWSRTLYRYRSYAALSAIKEYEVIAKRAACH